MQKLLSLFQNLSVERFFVIFAFVFGLIYVFLVPPFQNVDESQHYFRVIGVLYNAKVEKQDNIVGAFLEKRYINFSSDYVYLIKNINEKTNYKIFEKSYTEQAKEFAAFSNTALYFSLSYLPALLGGLLGKNLPIAFGFYLMRFFNLIAYILFGLFVIRKIPILKSTIMILLMLPMSLSLGAAVTSDVIVIGCNFLWITIILSFLCSEQKINKFDIMILFGLSAIVAVCKNYFFTIFLVLLLPIDKFSSKLKYYITVCGVIVFALFCSGCWCFSIRDFIVPLNDSANSFSQLTFIYHNPLLYIWILAKSVLIKLPRIIITMIGVLGYQDTRLDFFTYIAYPLIYCSSLFGGYKLILEKWQKRVLAFIVFCSFLIIMTYMYLSWSPIGARIITGVNGKYFIPMMPVFSIFVAEILKERNIIISETNFRTFAYLIIVICLFTSVLSIAHRFYGLTPNLYYSI